jgi:hypothetical protein
VFEVDCLRVVQILAPIPPWWFTDSAVDLDFQNNRLWEPIGGEDTTPDFTAYLSCSRASTGYAKTADGTLVNFGNNALRITDLGLLVEDARTNFVFRSQELGNAVWSTTFTSATTDATTAPDGTSTVEKLIATSSGGADQHRILQSDVSSDGFNAKVFSVFCKAAEKTAVGLSISDRAGGTVYADFDLTNGLTGHTAQTGSWTGVGSSIEAFGDGWYRCSVTGVKGAGALGCEVFINTLDSYGGALAWNSPGSVGVYAWGAQFEEASFASSYIPTTSASATRATDVVTFTGSVNSIINGTAASALLDVTCNIDSNIDNMRILGSSDGFGILIGITNGNDLQANTGTGQLVDGSFSLQSPHKAACSYITAGGGRSLVLDGGTVATDSNASGASGNATLGKGASGGGTPSWFNFRRFVGWSSRLADATLQSRTAP